MATPITAGCHLSFAKKHGRWNLPGSDALFVFIGVWMDVELTGREAAALGLPGRETFYPFSELVWYAEGATGAALPATDDCTNRADCFARARGMDSGAISPIRHGQAGPVRPSALWVECQEGGKGRSGRAR